MISAARGRLLPRLLFVPSLLALSTCLARAQGVVIHEIHYNPPEGAQYEFVELFNAAGASIDVSGWRFDRGLDFTIPSGTLLSPGAFLAVAKSPDLLAARFSIPPGALVGGFESNLDNGGETISIVDASGLIRDQVRYDDAFPWPEAADGGGASLERLCPSSPSAPAATWSASGPGGPTPGRANGAFQCPPPARPVPPVVLNEIFYHPSTDQDSTEEYVELRSTLDQTIDISGWSFTSGVSFVFPPGTLLEPQGLLVLAANPSYIATTYGISNVVGGFTGVLANDGERLELSDSSGVPVDAVRYRDQEEWPVPPDGLGFSLEKIDPRADGSDPASWRTSTAGGGGSFQAVELTGPATSSTVYVYLEGAGEALVDDISITPEGDPGAETIPGGDLNAGATGWSFTGNHIDSRWQPDGGVGNTGCVRLVSTGAGGSSGNSMNRATNPALTVGAVYRVRFSYRLVSGRPPLVVRLSGSTTTNGIFKRVQAGNQVVTPGKENSAFAPAVPPFATRVQHGPLEPRSTERPVVTCHVRSVLPVASVELSYRTTGGAITVALLDNGQSGDGLAGDGIYGVRLPTFPHGSVVRYRVAAKDAAGGSSTFPPANDPSADFGVYVHNDQPASPLPVYHVLVSNINNLGCASYATGDFVHAGDVYLNVGVRNRGQSTCGQTKQNLKVRFNRGRFFQGKHKINLNSMWDDKSLIREKLAWDAFRDNNQAACECYHVRVQNNGVYHGLFVYIEHPDKYLLERTGLDPAGNLYKAVASTEQKQSSIAGYMSAYEKKTNEEAGDYSDIATFLDALNTVSSSTVLGWLHQNVDIENEIDYQATVVGVASTDHNHKNHYLYHDPGSGLWRHMIWDIELTYGRIWDGANGGLYNDAIRPYGVNLFYGDGGGNQMTTRLFSARGSTGLRYFDRAFYGRLWAHLREKTNETVTDGQTELLRDLLQDEQALDIVKWGRYPPRPDLPNHPPDFNYNVDELLDIGAAAGTGYLRRRMVYLRGQLAQTGFTGYPWVRITEIHYDPDGPLESLEFLEIHNTEAKAVDVSGWYVDTIDYELPAGTSLAAGETIVIAKDLTAFRSRYGPGPRAFGPYPGNLGNGGDRVRLYEYRPGAPPVFPKQHPITIDFVAYGSKSPWPEEAAGGGKSLELRDLALDNDYASSWRASYADGGTPGLLTGDNRPPVIVLAVSKTRGLMPLSATFDASGSSDPDGDSFAAVWDFGDGGLDTGLTVTHTFTRPGVFEGVVVLEDGVTPPVSQPFQIVVFQGPTQNLFRRGDVNADGVVDLSDAVRILLGLFTGNSVGCRRAADVDDSGSLNVTDPVALLNYLFKNGPQPRAPFPECGEDATADSLECNAHAPCN